MEYEVKKHFLTVAGKDIDQFLSPHAAGNLDPIILVIHYTASGPNSEIAKYFSSPSAKVSAHLVIRRDGSVIQCVPFDRVAWHAGRSDWWFADGVYRSGLNQHAIGIEIENWGPLQRSPAGWLSWTGAPVEPSRVIEARHKYGTPDGGWETFTEAQIDSAVDVSRAICERYGIREIVGHDDISPGRKSDPGPAWKMDSFISRVLGRAEDDDSAFRVKSESGLNLRAGPGMAFDLVRKQPIPNGTKVTVHEAQGSWRLVSVLDQAGIQTETGWVNATWLSATA